MRRMRIIIVLVLVLIATACSGHGVRGLMERNTIYAPSLGAANSTQPSFTEEDLIVMMKICDYKPVCR